MQMSPGGSTKSPVPAQRLRVPRYTSEKPLEKRSEVNDKKSLVLAGTALWALQDQHNKAKKKRKGDSLDVPENVTDAENASQETAEERLTIEQLETSLARPPIIYGSRPECMLPLRSMYDGTGEWPKRKDPNLGAKQYSWSNIGFPKDKSLKVPEFEDDTYIDSSMPHIAQLVDIIRRVRITPVEGSADIRELQVTAQHNRTIMNFTMGGWTVTKVMFSDVDAFAKPAGQSYSKCEIASAFEIEVTSALGTQPELAIEQWAVAQVLLAKGGDIGGRTQDYWMRARDLGRQQLHVSPDLEREIREEMQNSYARTQDPAFSQMLRIVKEAIKNKTHNPYFQSRRDAYAVENGVFHHIKNTDIAMILDKNNELIAFQCADAFRKILSKSTEKNVTRSFEVFSTLQPLPIPDMTRHGLHFIDWLAERPDLDFRNPDNNPREAKSGVYHYGVHCAIGDPNGMEGLQATKDSGSRIIDSLKVAEQLYKLRHNALGACTELVTFFFELLDPELLADYRKVAAEITNLGYLPFETRRTNEPFAMRALLINLMTNEHKDTSDWHQGYAGTVVVGDFVGGDLLFRELGLRIESAAGCVQLFRGRELRHSISKWQGRRSVVVNVTHEAVKRWGFRQRGEPVSQSSTHTTADNCICVEQEDILPEEQRILSERERIPERWDPQTDDEGESSGGEVLVAPRLKATKERLNSSSDASGEQSS